MPHVNIFSNYYYMGNGLVYDSDKQIDYNKLILTNDSTFFKPSGNIIDITIFKWLKNNYYDIKIENQPKVISKKYLIDVNNSNERMIKENEILIPNALRFTKYYQVINMVHKFKYNHNEYYRLIEKQKYNEAIKSKLADYNFENLEELNWLNKGLKYHFINVNGRITGRGFNLTKFDRKKYLSLFKTDKMKNYYHLDFSSFEPKILFGLYLGKNINYDTNAIDFKLDRATFKQLFIAWLNGAGDKVLGEYKPLFETKFSEVNELRNKLTSNVLINYYAHRLITDSSYKRLGLLMQSTAYDYLKEVYLRIYEIGKVSVVWSLFDEMLIEVDADFNIVEWINNIKMFDFMEIKYKEI